MVRDIASEVYRDIALNVDLPHAPLFVIGMIKACLSCPEKFVSNGKVKLFKSEDFAAIHKSMKDVIVKTSATQLKGRALLTTMGLASEADAPRLIGELDARLIMYAFGKTAPNRRTFKAMAEIGVSFYDALCESFGPRASAHASPWSYVPLAIAASSSSDKPMKLRELSASGEITMEFLSDEGYKVGVRVLYGEAPIYTIKDFDVASKTVTLTSDSTIMTNVQFATLVGYKVLKDETKDIMNTCMYARLQLHVSA